jgi:hypothetical protein
MVTLVKFPARFKASTLDWTSDWEYGSPVFSEINVLNLSTSMWGSAITLIELTIWPS